MVDGVAVGGEVVDGGAAMAFVFVGASLALDLVNTEVVVRGRPRDLLGDPAAFAAWWRAARERYPDVAGAFPRIGAGAVGADGETLLAAAKELRAALRRVFTAVTDGGDGRGVRAADLAILNRVLATGHAAVAVGAEGGFRVFFASREAGPDGALLPIAHAARDLLTGKDLARLHRCGNERCVLLFYDTTKSATRRWCSVACMNRARSTRRYRDRTRASSVDA